MSKTNRRPVSFPNLNQIPYDEALEIVQGIMGNHLILPERAGLVDFHKDPPPWRYSPELLQRCAKENQKGSANWWLVPQKGMALVRSWLAVCKDCAGLQQNPDATWFLAAIEAVWFLQTGVPSWLLIDFLTGDRVGSVEDVSRYNAASLRAYAEACINIFRATGLIMGAGYWHSDFRTTAADELWLQVKMTENEGLELSHVYNRYQPCVLAVIMPPDISQPEP